MKVYCINRRFVFVTIVLFAFCSIFCTSGFSQAGARTEIKIPHIRGYITMKCDFHMHTVFSDGKVWPTIRPEEAWRQGLDAFAITDHIEYLPFKDDVRTNPNRSYEIARPIAQALGLTIVRGAEITRPIPPGHFNAIFLQDANALATKEWRDAIKAAIKQKAFVFYNHPGWQQPENKSVWYAEHSELLEKGWLHGIEIVNENTYYPLAHKWALQKKLTMLGNSDVHNPTGLDYDLTRGQHRSMTLVFAKEKTIEAIKEALFAQRSAVYWQNTLIGKAEYLKQIFERSIQIVNPKVTLRGKNSANIQIHNKTEIDFLLSADGTVDELSFPQQVTLYAGKTVLVKISGKSGRLSGEKNVRIPYKVRNLLIAPEKYLRVALVIDVNFVPTERKKN
ncbi:MAG: Sb-PDE family phosphodiesterase [Sedimentisphaerales bacterium]